jgi:hypothetical protein
MDDEPNPPAHALDDTCKAEGAVAAEAGDALASDPYLPGTPEFAQWMEGWCNRTAIRQLAPTR